jgi:hypothetical protein
MSNRSHFRWRAHVALIAVAAALVLAAPAEAEGVIGGQLLATGGTVDIVVQPATAVFTTQLFLLRPDGTRQNISLNTEVGKHVTIGPFPAGQELVFGITGLDDGPTFFIGPASRNPDGIAHAVVTEAGVRTFLVGFEDLFGGGDRDYDDNVFQFTGNLAPKPPPPLADDDTLTNPTPNPTSNPKLTVPRLKVGEARRRLPSVLRKQYGSRYTSRRGPLERSCYRLASEKVRCGVGWNTGRYRYSGKATMWHDRDHPRSIRCTTSIRRTRGNPASH